GCSPRRASFAGSARSLGSSHLRFLPPGGPLLGYARNCVSHSVGSGLGQVLSPLPSGFSGANDGILSRADNSLLFVVHSCLLGAYPNSSSADAIPILRPESWTSPHHRPLVLWILFSNARSDRSRGACQSTGSAVRSRIDGSSLSGLFTRVEIGQMVMASAG